MRTVKCYLERDELHFSGTDCAVFTEVLEYLHHYVSSILAKMNKAPKPSNYLIMTMPNITSLHERIFHLLGRCPFL